MAYHPLLNIAIQAARSASRIILRSIDRLDTVSVTEKSRNDFVTDVDKRAEQEIIYVIKSAYPEHSFLAEESGAQRGSGFCWVIDPLDGTTNFIHGFPQWAISIAVKNADQLEVGVIYDPLRDELFTATRGAGAQLNNRKIRVSKVEKFEKALLGTGFPFKEMQNVEQYLKGFANILPKVSGIRRAGSAALDLAYVACGRFDGFWETGLSEWDIAAGALIIKEAGGMISDYQGEANFLGNGEVVAGNPKIHKELLIQLKA